MIQLKHILFFCITLFSLSSFAQQKRIWLSQSCQVWGVCKYYSNTSIDWDQEFFDQYNQLEKIKSKEEFNAVVSHFLTSARAVNTTETDTTFTPSDFNTYWNIPDTNSLFVRVNFDWIRNSKELNTPNKLRLISLLKHYQPKKPQTIKSEGRYSISHNKEKVYSEVFSKANTLLTLFRLYNVIEYYYPYKHLLDYSWEEALLKSSSMFANAKDIEGYKKAVIYFISFIQDTHVSAERPKNDPSIKKDIEAPWNEYPLVVEYAEEELFISKTYSPSIANQYGIEVGDQILTVNNLSVDSLLELTQRKHSCSHNAELFESLCFDVYQYAPLRLGILKSDSLKVIEIEKIEMSFLDFDAFVTPKRTLKSVQEIGSDIGYIYLPEATYANIDNSFKLYQDKKALILDCRGYGTGAMMKLPKLLSKNTHSVSKAYYPNSKYPGVYKQVDNQTNYYSSSTADLFLKAIFRYQKKVFPTFNTPYQGKIIVLIDENAMSWGESVIMVIKAYAPNATFIGRATQGANGNITDVVLPTGHIVYFTGVDFRFPDGTELQRKGIQPNVKVPLSKASLISQQDEILKTALDYIFETYGIK